MSAPDTLTAIDTLVIPSIPQEKDTLNVTDSLGMRQGHWLFFGSDFPNSGVGSSELLEEGRYSNNQRTGTWYRYGPNQQLKAVMLFRFDPKANTAVRDQFYHYTYHSNGSLKRKPVIGRCRTMSDYFVYGENGELLEIELFDSTCTTSYKLQRIQKGELDSVSILLIDDRFTEEASATGTPKNTISFDQTGEYYVDYDHRIFQVGSFEKGQLIDGREYYFDDMMRAGEVRYFQGGKLVKRMVKKAT
jgi:hypothetical protein